MEEVGEQESWNKKRIFFTLVLIAVLIAGILLFKNRILDTNTRFFQEETKTVKGVSTKEKLIDEEFKANVQEAVKEKINNIKQQVSGLNIVEIASSSPQVQKIISDIKSLEQYPTNQAKEICRKICGL